MPTSRSRPEPEQSEPDLPSHTQAALDHFHQCLHAWEQAPDDVSARQNLIEAEQSLARLMSAEADDTA